MKIRRIRRRRMKQREANTKKEAASYHCSSKWSEEIGDDVFGLILQRLCLTDYLRTLAVCSTWRSFVPRSIANNKSCPPLLPELPLVFLETQASSYFSFFNLSTKRAFDLTAGYSNFDCYGSIQGWLIMTDRTWTGFRTVFFFNPLTKARVLVPSRLKCVRFRIQKLMASTKPSDPNCVVVCVFRSTSELAISGVSDESWTVIDHEDKRIFFADVEILNGKLYALIYTTLNVIAVCDLQNKPLKLRLLAVKHPLDGVSPICTLAHFSRVLAIDDDASSGDLLQIYMRYESIYWENNKEKIKSKRKKKKEEEIYVPELLGSWVYKFSSSEDKWIEVNSLRNRMLFVSRHKSLVVSNIGDLHGPQDLIKDNCIYFTCLDPKREGIIPRKGIRIVRYCQSDEKTDHYTCERLISDSVLSSVWFIPSFS